jgi:DNA-binding MarR family transcriptional regulator
MPTVDKIPPMHLCNAFTLRRAARVVTQVYERHLSQAGVTSAQFSILTALKFTPGMTMTALAQTMGMERTTLVRALKPLQRDGLVLTQAKSAGSRQLQLSLSADGYRKFDEGLRHWRNAQQAFEAHVGEKRAKALREELLEVADMT